MTFVSNNSERSCFSACSQDKIDAGLCVCVNNINNGTTDLSKVAEAFKNSTVKLDDEFWEKQNEKIRENQERFAKEGRKLTPKTPEQKISELSREVEELKETLSHVLICEWCDKVATNIKNGHISCDEHYKYL